MVILERRHFIFSWRGIFRFGKPDEIARNYLKLIETVSVPKEFRPAIFFFMELTFYAWNDSFSHVLTTIEWYCPYVAGWYNRWRNSSVCITPTDDVIAHGIYLVKGALIRMSSKVICSGRRGRHELPLCLSFVTYWQGMGLETRWHVQVTSLKCLEVIIPADFDIYHLTDCFLELVNWLCCWTNVNHTLFLQWWLLIDTYFLQRVQRMVII